jgi:hypothetical protein
MKSKCKTCGKNCEGEYCFIHKPRKPLAQSKLNRSAFSAGNTEEISEMREFFLLLWKKFSHYSMVSGKYLGSEPLSIFFHHILPKEKYPEARLDEENIIFLTLDEHSDVENNMYKYPEINTRREILKKKYERT